MATAVHAEYVCLHDDDSCDDDEKTKAIMKSLGICTC
jgi:hypothetical protein